MAVISDTNEEVSQRLGISRMVMLGIPPDSKDVLGVKGKSVRSSIVCLDRADYTKMVNNYGI